MSVKFSLRTFRKFPSTVPRNLTTCIRECFSALPCPDAMAEDIAVTNKNREQATLGWRHSVEQGILALSCNRNFTRQDGKLIREQE